MLARSYFLILGSPPPMRGKVFFSVTGKVYNGITPAYAGKSAGRKAAVCGRKDHPRLCGEKLTQNCGRHQVAGSPPPMRGKVIVGVICIRNGGITPAYAGKRLGIFIPHHVFQDHPRLCGEKAIRTASMMCASGSPPPMRGKEDTFDSYSWQTRITPAYAGKRSIATDCSKTGKDHPRLCGEKVSPATSCASI